MRLAISIQLVRSWYAVLLVASLNFAPLLMIGYGQEEKPSTEAIKEGSKEKEGGVKEDRFEIPKEASVQELFAWISKAKRTPPPRDRIEETAKKLFPAIIQACDLILEQSDSLEDQKKAIQEKFSAYGILVRYLPAASSEFDAMSKKYAEDSRPEIAQLATGILLGKKSEGMRDATAEEAQQLASEALVFLDRFGIDRDTLSPISTIARNLSYSSHTEIAAVFHESLSKLFEDSEDANIRKRASKFLGAARRIRLPGNQMELFGSTGSGEAFDWESYRGRVVLVDFWASWCGPCIGELPNMKKNLETYGDRGFAIVGINMDSTREAFEKCVEEKEISWVNLFSEEDGKQGWDAPIANFYGISGIPTAILVDQKGKVVSIRARGAELDKLLEELLGAP